MIFNKFSRKQTNSAIKLCLMFHDNQHKKHFVQCCCVINVICTEKGIKARKYQLSCSQTFFIFCKTQKQQAGIQVLSFIFKQYYLINQQIP